MENPMQNELPAPLSEILNALSDYAKDKNQSQAVLLDGAWGSGKSYFVKTYLIPTLKELTNTKNKAITPIPISLYGLCSREEARQVVINTLLLELTPGSNNPVKTALNAVKDVFAGFLDNQFGVRFDFSKAVIEKFTEKKAPLLIFDDFERASMNPIELMGVLNDFVENWGYKALLVADEEHMFHAVRGSEEALALKTAAAFQYNGEWPSELKDKEANDTERDLWRKRVVWLFQQEDLYKITKEKLIGLTLHYRPDFESAFQKIVSDYIGEPSDSVAQFVTEHKQFIQEQLGDYRNLRTLIKACSAMKKLLEPVLLSIERAESHPEWRKEEAEEILRQILSETIRQAEGAKLFNWSEDNSTRRYREYRTDVQEMRDYRFVDEFLETYYCDRDRIMEDLDSYIEERERKESRERAYEEEQRRSQQLALSLLDRQWYYLSDSKVKDLLDTLYGELRQQGNYLPGQFKAILINLIEIQNPNFGGISSDQGPVSNDTKLPNGKTIREYVDLMIKRLPASLEAIGGAPELATLSDGGAVAPDAQGASYSQRVEQVQSILEYLQQSPFSDSEGNQSYKGFIKPLLEELRRLKEEALRGQLEDMPQLQGESFVSDCIAFQDRFEEWGRFLSLYGIDNLLATVQNASGKETRKLAKAISSVYSNAIRFTDESSFIHELSEELKKPEYEKTLDETTNNLIESRSKRIWMKSLRDALQSVEANLGKASYQ